MGNNYRCIESYGFVVIYRPMVADGVKLTGSLVTLNISGVFRLQLLNEELRYTFIYLWMYEWLELLPIKVVYKYINL